MFGKGINIAYALVAWGCDVTAISTTNKINRDVKILLMSAFEIDTFRFDLKEITIEGFLKKPMHLNQLLSMVESCIIKGVIT